MSDTPRTDALYKPSILTPGIVVYDARITTDQQYDLARELERENARLRSELEWTSAELMEVMRIVGPPDGTDDDVTRLMKLTAIRRMAEADEERYLALAQRGGT